MCSDNINLRWKGGLKKVWRRHNSRFDLGGRFSIRVCNSDLTGQGESGATLQHCLQGGS